MKDDTYRLFGVAPALTVGARIDNLVSRWSAGDCKGKCGLVRVAGSLVSAVRQAGGVVTPNQPQSVSQISAAPYVKLAIATRDGIGRIIIDADSSVILPGRSVCQVELLAPSTWGEVTPQSSGTGLVWDVFGAVQIEEVCGIADPRGHLTEFISSTGPVTFIRPRGTRRVQFFQQSFQQTWELWAGDPAVPGLQVGTVFVPAFSDGLVELMPGITHIRHPVTADGSVARFGMVWEVAPL